MMYTNSTAGSGALAFSSDSSEAITRHKEVSISVPAKRSDESVREYFEVDRCTQFVSNSGFKRVALQFPDGLLRDAPRVAQLIRGSTWAEVVVLGDTSYGSCCVDEVAAEHVQSDCIIHFGPSCLTRTKRLPVLHIFGSEPVEIKNCAASFRGLFPDMDSHVLVMCDTVYTHCLGHLKDHLAEDYKNVVFSCLSGTHTEADSEVKGPVSCNGRQMDPAMNAEGADTWTYRRTITDQLLSGLWHHEVLVSLFACIFCGGTCALTWFGRLFTLKRPVEEYQIFYIGTEGPTLSNFLLNYSGCQFYSYSPVNMVSRREGVNVNKALGRRYFLIQKAKVASTVGILVGTLGAADYLEIIERIKAILKRVGKKYYSIAMGKLNPAKLANFMEIDIFVLVSCSENSLIDSQDFYKPIITPFELEIACLRSGDWGTGYTTDYQDLITGPPVSINSDPSEDVPEYSLISGRLISSSNKWDHEDGSSSALTEKSYGELAVCSSAVEFLHSRSWQGLEQRLGESSVEKAVLGEDGVPRMYSHELRQLDTLLHL